MGINGNFDDLSGYMDVYIYISYDSTNKKWNVDGNTLNIIEPTTNADLVVIQWDLMGFNTLWCHQTWRNGEIPDLNRGF